MSWDQEYSIPSYTDLLLKLTEKDHSAFVEMLQADLRDRLGITVVKTETILLADGMFQDVMGLKVTLSDGRIFAQKLTERHIANGNWGNDIYDWCLISNKPEVLVFDHSEPIPAPGEYGQTDEASLASDGELASAEADVQCCTCDGVDHCHCDSDRFCTPDCWSKEPISDSDLREEGY